MLHGVLTCITGIIFIILGLVRGEGLWSQFTPLSTSGVRLLAFTHGLYISLALMPAILYLVFAKNPSRWVYILIVVWIIGIVGTLMRHLWIAIFGVLVALFIFLPKERREQLWKKIWLFVIPAGAAALIFFYFAVMAPQSDFSRTAGKSFGILSQRASSLVSVAGDESFSWRSLVWESAYAEFKHNPILGIGAGHRIYVETVNYRDFVEIRNIHNSYLAILIQLGLVGASIILGQLRRAAVDLAKDWRTDRLLRRLEALLIVADRDATLIVSGTGDVIEPEDGIAAIGSGGSFALAAARVLRKHSTLDARAIVEESLRTAAEICIYTNDQLVVEELDGGAA